MVLPCLEQDPGLHDFSDGRTHATSKAVSARSQNSFHKIWGEKLSIYGKTTDDKSSNQLHPIIPHHLFRIRDTRLLGIPFSKNRCKRVSYIGEIIARRASFFNSVRSTLLSVSFSIFLRFHEVCPLLCYTPSISPQFRGRGTRSPGACVVTCEATTTALSNCGE